jgi:hypothetical protein
VRKLTQKSSIHRYGIATVAMRRLQLHIGASTANSGYPFGGLSYTSGPAVILVINTASILGATEL